MTERIGFIGLGVMGRPMARNLLARGFSVVVHSRSRGPVDELVAAGAQAAKSPADVARQSAIVMTMVPDSPDVEAVLEGPTECSAALAPGSLIIDCSTIAPAVARRLAARAAELGSAMIDAPVSGGEVGAMSASLSIMIGGDAAAVERARPVLEAMGNKERIVHIGPSGSGQLCKVCNQMVIGGTLAAVSEAFALARKAGVDPARVRTVLLGGFASSRVLDAHGERILNSNYVPGLPNSTLREGSWDRSGHARGISNARAGRGGRPAARDGTVAAGHADTDYSALATVLFDLAGLDRGDTERSPSHG